MMEDQLIKYFQNELTKDERVSFLKKLSADPALKEQYLAYQKLVTIIELKDKDSDKKEGRDSYQGFINKNKNKFIQRGLYKFLQYAAVIAITISATWMFSTKESIPDTSVTKLYVPAGQRAQLTLCDGTEVWLNAQSTLIYPTTFSAIDRRVTLIGEAFFDVAKNKEKPFIVSSKEIEMKVLGTSFNVYSYPEIDGIEACLLEGSIQVYESNTPKESKILQPNEQITCVNGQMNVSSISDIESLRWKEGIYAFNNVPFSEIIKKLELYYDVKIKVENQKINNFKYTGKFRQRDGIDEILRIIQKIHKFSIEKSEDGAEIQLS